MKISDTNAKMNLRSTKTFVAIIIIIFLILIVIMSPVFQVRSINFQGGEHYSKEEILSKLGINMGDNVFMIKAKHSENQLKKDPFINSVNIDVQYPNTLNIVIKERKVRGYVPYMGAYLYIDEQGRVLEVANAYKQKLPIVEGLEFDEFHKGDILKVKNMDSFDVVLKTANMMLKYEFIDDVVKIDASDPKNIHLYIRHIDVLLGDLNDYDEKIRTMLEVVKKIPEQDRGFLNIKDLTKPIIFEYLT